MESHLQPERIDEPGRATTVVQGLIALSIGVWLLQLTLASAADVRALLGFASSDVDAWWTVLTYPFVQGSVWALAISTYALWRFGSRVEAQWGSAPFAWYYVLCGIGGWLFQLLFVREGVLIGSAGPVTAVLLAYASIRGDERIAVLGTIPMTVRWFTGLFVLANLALTFSGTNGTGTSILAHFGAIAAGWCYLRMASSMDIERLRRHVAPVADEPEDVPPRAIPPRAGPRKRVEREARDVDEIVQQSQAAIAERTANAPARDATPLGATRTPSAEINALLDKISAHGLHALTPAERDQLEDAARRLRGS